MEYHSWKLSSLQSELRSRGVVSHGRKKDLVQRLEALDKMGGFSAPSTVPTASGDIPNWPSSASVTFRSVCQDSKTSLPTFQQPHLDQYILLNQASSSSNIDPCTGNASKKAHKLTEDNVLGLSYCVVDQDFFFTGIVGATMKKVTYNIRFSTTASGEIMHSSCECPAGKGPKSVCVHVRASFLILVKFMETGELDILVSCTDELQQFHKPRKVHAGSPIRVEQLGQGITEIDDDPRQMHLRNREAYTSEVFMRTVNYCYQSNKDVFLRYAFSKANVQEASVDHSYLSRPMTHY